VADGARERATDATESPAVLRAVADALRDWLDLLGGPPARRLVLTRDDGGTRGGGEGWVAVDARAFRAFVALAASALARDTGGGEATKACGWCTREGHTTDEHHDHLCEMKEPLGRAAGATWCGCAERARASLPPAAPPCFLCGDPCPGDATDASAAHDRCREVYGEGLHDGANEDPRCSACGCRSVAHGDEDGDGITCPHGCTGYFYPPASPPRPAGVDREALAAAVARLDRAALHYVDCPNFKTHAEGWALDTCGARGDWSDVLDALAPLLGVTGEV